MATRKRTRATFDERVVIILLEQALSHLERFHKDLFSMGDYLVRRAEAGPDRSDPEYQRLVREGAEKLVGRSIDSTEASQEH